MVAMLYFEQLLVAKVIYDVYDATEYEVNVYMYSCVKAQEMTIHCIVISCAFTHEYKRDDVCKL